MKKFIVGLAIFIFCASVFIFRSGYHGPREFPVSKTGLPSPETVIANARGLAGAPYDPFGGKYGNIGAKAGFIVCSDVPNIAYGLSGFALQRMLEEDYKGHPSSYGKNPQDK
jgi:hypothetical protein